MQEALGGLLPILSFVLTGRDATAAAAASAIKSAAGGMKKREKKALIDFLSAAAIELYNLSSRMGQNTATQMVELKMLMQVYRISGISIIKGAPQLLKVKNNAGWTTP